MTVGQVRHIIVGMNAKPTLVEQSKSRVLAWLAREAPSPTRRAEIAKQASLHERTLRRANDEEWDPRASTLSRLERLIQNKRRAA